MHGFFYYLFADRDENFKSYKVQDKKSPPNSDLSHIIMVLIYLFNGINYLSYFSESFTKPIFDLDPAVCVSWNFEL